MLSWRWRGNALRRRSDVVEAWAFAATWMLALLAGVLAGLSADGAVEAHMARARAERHPVVAQLTEDAPAYAPATADGVGTDHVWAKVRWTLDDGATRTGTAMVDPGAAKGSDAKVWVSAGGRLVPEPPSEGRAQLESALMGFLSGAGVGSLVLVGGRGVRCGLMRRRMDEWGEQWERIEPLWRWKTR
ncbi:hypothetical protein ACIBUY_27430 [Streptomyces sp. NPDC050085]|uniref:Rv1733c family protein n=1 Tax=Streptomyces sp. NPDC050085 TaxID=3365600 RepID=UPI0037A7DE31